MNYIITEEILLLQKQAGIITENQYKEKVKKIQEKELSPTEVLDNGTLRDAFFVSGDKDLEVDKDIFTNYVLTHKNKLKRLWNSSGGNWDQDQITDDNIKKASDIFYQKYPERYYVFDSILQSPYGDSPKENLAMNILIAFDENIENKWLNIFLDDLNDVINQ